MRRARLLLALEEQLHVHGRSAPARAERVETREDRDDRALVVARAARVEARLRGERLLPVEGEGAAPLLLERAVAQRGGEGRARPLLRVDGLPVVVRVDGDGPLRARRREPREDGRRPAGLRRQQARGEAAPLEHRDERVRVLPDVRRVCRDVRDREEGRELRHDIALVRGRPRARRPRRLLRARRGGEERSPERGGGEARDQRRRSM